MKRATFRIVFFLVLGTTINVAVAWGCAAWPRAAVMLFGNEPRVLLAEDVAWWNAHVRPQFGCEVGGGYLTRDRGVQGRLLFGPSASETTVTAIRLSSGWPARSFAGDAWAKINPKPLVVQWESAAALVNAGNSFMIPFRPLWPGFVINTILYAVIVWGLYFAVVTLRRVRRKEPGFCTVCGYDLRHADHAVCPECGATP